MNTNTEAQTGDRSKSTALLKDALRSFINGNDDALRTIFTMIKPENKTVRIS